MYDEEKGKEKLEEEDYDDKNEENKNEENKNEEKNEETIEDSLGNLSLSSKDDDDEPFPVSQYPFIYENLVKKSRPLRKRMKLKWAIRVLYHQWEKEDWFPKKQQQDE